jgi:hypothetical protein
MKRLAARFLVASFASTVAGVMLASSAIAATGQITRADATADWSQGSVAGSVAGLEPASYGIDSWARAYVVPNGAVCTAFEVYDPKPPDDFKVIWESASGDQNPSFDLPDVTLNSGISPRVCLYSVYRANFWLPGVYYRTLLASRFFTVPPPPPPLAQGTPPVATLSRATALSKATSALKKRFGKAYKRGKRKRLSCAKQSSTRYRCAFSFRYRKKRRQGIAIVSIKPNGAITTKIKRR